MTDLDLDALTSYAKHWRRLQPLKPIPLGIDDVDALIALARRAGDLEKALDWLWGSQHQYHGGARESCRFEWCQRLAATAQPEVTG